MCAVSVQYLQQPERVFAEVARVLKPGGVAVFSFSNRLFYDKAVSAWRDNSGYGRTQLVRSYFQAAGFEPATVVREADVPLDENKDDGPLAALRSWLLDLWPVPANPPDPFYAVYARKPESEAVGAQ